MQTPEEQAKQRQRQVAQRIIDDFNERLTSSAIFSNDVEWMTQEIAAALQAEGDRRAQVMMAVIKDAYDNYQRMAEKNPDYARDFRQMACAADEILDALKGKHNGR